MALSCLNLYSLIQYLIEQCVVLKSNSYRKVSHRDKSIFKRQIYYQVKVINKSILQMQDGFTNIFNSETSPGDSRSCSCNETYRRLYLVS